jgi:hypothetical protein
MPDLVCIFVLLHEAGKDEFYIFRMRELQEHFFKTYLGGPRPRNPNSMHCAVWPQDLQDHRDKWEVVHEGLRISGASAVVPASAG